LCERPVLAEYSEYLSASGSGPFAGIIITLGRLIDFRLELSPINAELISPESKETK
jgi:hypothetical protein